MNKQERKAWDELVNYAYKTTSTEGQITSISSQDLQAITAADVLIRRLERQLGEKKVAALLNAKFNKVLSKGN